MNLPRLSQLNRMMLALNVGALGLWFFLLPITAQAQVPSDAQTKKELTGAKTVSVTLGKPGKIEWSTTYKKYMWCIAMTSSSHGRVY